MPHLQELAERHPGLTVIVVSLWSDPGEAGRVLAAEGYSGLALFDPSRGAGDDSPAAEAFGIGVIPAVVLLDREGRVAASLEAPEPGDLERALRRLGFEQGGVPASGPEPRRSRPPPPAGPGAGCGERVSEAPGCGSG